MCVHDLDELVLPLQQSVSTHAGDLTHGDGVTGDVELLVVGEQQVLSGTALTGGGGEDGLAQLFQGDIGDAGHAMGHINIPLGAGGRLEHDGVGDDGGENQAGHLGGGHEALLLIHTGHDGGGAANRLVADGDGVLGLNIGQTVVVHDLQNLSLVQTGHGLCLLVVVHQHDLLAAGTEQMEPGQRADNFVVLVQDGICAETALQHGVADIVHIVGEVEVHQILALADALNGRGMADQTHGLIGVIGGGDDAGVGLGVQQLLLHLCLADDDAVHVEVQRPLDHVGLIAADHNGVGVGEQQVLAAGGQCHGDRAADDVPQFALGVQNLALQHGQQIVNGDVADPCVPDGAHVISGHVAGGEHTIQGAVLVGHGQSGDLLGLHGLPGAADGRGGGQDGRPVIFQIQDLGPHIVDEHGRLKAEAVQDALGLVVDLTQAGGLIVPLAQGVLQCGIGHGRDNGVGVGVPVTRDINRICILGVQNSVSSLNKSVG